MKVVVRNIWVCSECMIWLVNGDVSGVDDDTRAEEIMDRASQLGAHVVPDFDSDTGAGMRDFSIDRCDCCGARGHGERHRFARLGAL